MKPSLNSPWTSHACARRLLEEYKKYGKLIVAFDFDNTIFDYYNRGLDCKDIIDLLAECSNKGFTMILFTCEEDDERLKWKKEYCNHYGIRVDYVNESPIYNTKKPYFNILLDDRAGLEEAMDTLNSVIQIIDKNECNKSDQA